MHRRDFLTASLTTVAAFKTVAAQAWPGPPAPVETRYQFSAERLRAMVGSRFRLTAADWRGHVRLAEVVEGPTVPGLDQFTIVFRSEEHTSPQPGVYEVDHPDAGRFALRIDGRDESGARLATFALLRA